MILQKEITIALPAKCDGCVFWSWDNDWGNMCQGSTLTYSQSQDGKISIRHIKTPQEALEHEFYCAFIKE